MKILFRTDASLQIGTGHVMRCLTLADALRVQGAECQFVCREHPGNLIRYIRDKGYYVHVLSVSNYDGEQHAPLIHAAWLGSSQEEDARYCKAIAKSAPPDWLIVDHYALAVQWERTMRPYCNRLMVIDDLSDRQHDCDLLLDQTFGRAPTDYRLRVPESCQLLCGSEYALLRPEFAQWRSYSLERRKKPELKRILINLGGVDKDNVTGQLLRALKQCSFSDDCEITVVMGATAPWIEEVRGVAQSLPWQTSVKIGVSNMAQLMAESDLAIGAAGATSWERCCLGLPTIMLVLADNQRLIAEQLTKASAVIIIEIIHAKQHLPQIIEKLSVQELKKMKNAGLTITNGQGVDKITKILNGQLYENQYLM